MNIDEEMVEKIKELAAVKLYEDIGSHALTEIVEEGDDARAHDDAGQQEVILPAVEVGVHDPAPVRAADCGVKLVQSCRKGLVVRHDSSDTVRQAGPRIPIVEIVGSEDSRVKQGLLVEVRWPREWQRIPDFWREGFESGPGPELAVWIRQHHRPEL